MQTLSSRLEMSINIFSRKHFQINLTASVHLYLCMYICVEINVSKGHEHVF